MSSSSAVAVAVAPSIAPARKRTHRSMVEEEVRALMLTAFEAGDLPQAKKCATWLDAITESTDDEFEDLIACI